MLKKLEIIFRKLFLKLYVALRSAEEQKQLPEITSRTRILFIRLNRIGDALVTTPLLHQIKKETGCYVALLAAPSNRFIFENKKLCDEVILFDKRNAAGIIKKLNRSNFDIVVDLHDDVSTTVSLIISKLEIPFKAGFRKGIDKLFTNLIERKDPVSNHVVDRVMSFCDLLGIKYNKEEVNIFYTPQDESMRNAGQFLKSHNYECKFIVGINISAGNNARFWGVLNYKKLLDFMLQKQEVATLLLCTKEDYKLAEEISYSRVPIFFDESFDRFAAMIGRLNLLFSPDTSIIHIGSSFQIPIFGLYVKFNTRDMIWSPYKSDFDCVITTEPNLDNVQFEEVIKKFSNFLNKAIDRHYANTKL